MSSYITSIGTANPPTRVTQAQFADFYADVLNLDERGRKKLKWFYRHTKIRTRHSVLADYAERLGSFTFYSNDPDRPPDPATSRRMEVFQEHAPGLAIEAIRDCVERSAGFDLESVDHLITVSCTGMYAPGLDVDLVEALGLPTTIERTAINFMGCFAAINALRIADALCRSRPGCRVLIVNVELPTIHFQSELDEEYMVSNALFGDGASAMIVEGEPSGGGGLRIEGFHSDMALKGKGDMAWRIGDRGFEVLLSEYVPMIVKGDVGRVVERLLGSLALRQEDVDFYAFHPGGRAILEAIEAQVGISAEDNWAAYEVLRDFGNMSSSTFVFVLQKIFENLGSRDRGKRVLGCSFGPGLTLEGVLLEFVVPD